MSITHITLIIRKWIKYTDTKSNHVYNIT